MPNMCECEKRTGRERLCGLAEFAWLCVILGGNVGFWFVVARWLF